MKKIDDRLIELFDRATTAMQRRAWLPLNTLIMGTECFFWSAGVAHSYVLAGLAAVWLCLGFAQWRDAHGYWDNHRKTQELNANVLLMRDWWRARLSGTLLLPLLTLASWDLVYALSNTAFVCILYLRCCRYLGPGDFAREKRESVAGALQEG